MRKVTVYHLSNDELRLALIDYIEKAEGEVLSGTEWSFEGPSFERENIHALTKVSHCVVDDGR